MKNQAIQYLAFDVHQATTVATVRDEHGAIRLRATVPTEASAILALVRGLGGRVHIAFEEGTQAQWMHDLLVPYAERVIVCNVRGRSETTNKSDRIDADGLSEMLRLGAVKSVYHGASGMLTLKELVRCYVNLVDDSTRSCCASRRCSGPERSRHRERRSIGFPIGGRGWPRSRAGARECGPRRCCGSSTRYSSCGRRPRRT